MLTKMQKFVMKPSMAVSESFCCVGISRTLLAIVLYAERAKSHTCGAVVRFVAIPSRLSTYRASLLSLYRPSITRDGFNAMRMLPVKVYICPAINRLFRQRMISGSLRCGKSMRLSTSIWDVAFRSLRSSVSLFPGSILTRRV